MWHKILKTLSYFLLGLCLLLFAGFLSLKQILDRKEIRNLVSDNIRKFIDLEVRYSEIESLVFPLPGLQIRNLEILDKEDTLAFVESIQIRWDVFALFKGEFKIGAVSLDDGKVHLTRDKEGRFPISEKLQSKKEEKEESKKDPDSILPLLPTKIQVRNFEFVLNDLPTETKPTVFFRDLTLYTNENDRSFDLSLKAEINQTDFRLETTTYLTENEWTYRSIRSDTEVYWKEAQLSQFQDLFSVFPNADFQSAKLDFGLELKKENADQVRLHVTKFSLEGIKRKTDTLIGDLFLELDFIFSGADRKIQLDLLEAGIGEFAHLKADGNIFLDEKERKADINVSSDFLDLKKVLFFKDSFSGFDASKFDLKKNEKPDIVVKKEDPIPVLADLKFHFKDLNLGEHYVPNLSGSLLYQTNEVIINPTEAIVYGGKVRTNGKLSFISSHPDLQLKGNIQNLNLEPLIGKFTKEKYIKGKLNSDFSIKCKLGGSETIKNSLDLKTKFSINQGKLLGYANFIQPVAMIGKLLNFNQTSKESTSFESITGGLDLYKQKATITDFNMKGEGLSAIGGGVYQTNGKIDMKFTVSLPGAVGKAVKLPILYRGVMGKNLAYIDPVWMASVYAGSIFFAGPAGAVVGGIAGSAVSDNMEKVVGGVKNSIDSFRSFFTGKEEEDGSRK
ncbi:AsmA family protein [Leptospira sp. 'Mane']|uniref:AsmA family protein n=1 Tax=Leptospira sp. 'Mane' TaxID=3387407 RepID=UPI00398A6119